MGRMDGRRDIDLHGVFDLLMGELGPTHWWPADTRFEVVVGAILIQNVSWINAQRALDALKGTGELTPERLAAMPDDELEFIIRPVGFYRAKARYLKEVCAWLLALPHGGADWPQRVADLDDDELRRGLLSVRGIGGETADDILLYVFDRPVFVADTYARRLFETLGVDDLPKSYEGFRRRVMPHIASGAWNLADLKELHGLIDEFGKTCRTAEDWRHSVIAGYRLVWR